MSRNLSTLVGVVSAALCLLAQTTAAEVPVPADFALRAQFFPGAGSSWMIPEEAAKMPKPWTVTISADGKASQATTFVADPRDSLPMLMRPGKGDLPLSAAEKRALPPPRLKRLQIGQSELKQIVQAIRDANFYSLPRELSTPFEYHTAAIVLHITMDGRSREVTFEWPNERFEKACLIRFWKVWSAVTRAVPSPNHNDELDYWTEAVGLHLPKQI